MRVKLQDIIDAIGTQFEEQYQYLNLETGDIVLIQNEYFAIAENQNKEDIEMQSIIPHG